MKNTITFIIPVRHQENSKDWSRLKSNLTQTIASIANQSSKDWRAVIIANEGADLPKVPAGFDIVRVNFPPNQLHDLPAGNKELFYDAFRLDKGRRVLKGMLHIPDAAYYMIVDDDDFVSSQLVDYVAANSTESGWKIRNGYVWGDGGQWLFLHNDFSNFCGTSLIIRSDLYKLPPSFEDASEDYIKTMLGSHVRIGKILQDKGYPLKPLPFAGAVYRVGHAGAHSNSPGLAKMYFFNKYYLLRPHKFLKNVLSLRKLTQAYASEFLIPTGVSHR